MVPVIPNSALDLATDIAMASGLRLMQGARMAGSDEAHVGRLLDFMNAPPGSFIADIGCGVGECARLMKNIRNDLSFVLINKNEKQLALAPPTFDRIHADMHDIPLPTGCVDGAMFCYSLCHSDFTIALREVARLTRKGGFLFVYDYERMHGDNDRFAFALFARALSREGMEILCRNTGWKVVFWDNPEADDTFFREAFANDEEYNKIFDELRVCAWKAERL